MKTARIFILVACLLVSGLLFTACSSDEPATVSGSTVASTPLATIPITASNAAQITQIKTLQSHNEQAFSVAFSPDGALLASGGGFADHTVRLWDTHTGESVRVIDAHKHIVWRIAFSPDGKTMATASEDGTLRLWEVATGKQLAELEKLDRAVYGAVFTPDGQTLASVDGYKAVKLWDAASRQQIGTLEGNQQLVQGLAISPDGTLLVTGGGDSTVRLWNLSTRESMGILGELGGLVNAVAFSPDGTWVASAALGSDKVTLWNVKTGASQTVLHGDMFSSGAYSVAFSPDGSVLAFGMGDGTIGLWDVAAGKGLMGFQGHMDEVDGLAFSPDGTLLASAGLDGNVILWGIGEGGMAEVTATPNSALAPEFSVTGFDGRQFALADMRGQVVVINFWASFAVPCQQEAPVLERVWNEYKDDGVVFLGINQYDTEDDAKVYLDRFHITYVNAPDGDQHVADQYGVTGVPETVVIDPSGGIVRHFIGPVDESKLRAEIERAMNAAPAVIETSAPAPIPTAAPLVVSPTPAPDVQVFVVTMTPLGGVCALNSEMIISGTGTAGLNVRSEPDYRGASVFLATEGERIQVIGGPQSANGMEWCQVRREQDGATGWAVLDYLAEAPEATGVPTNTPSSSSTPSPSGGDTLLVRSSPPGLKVYVVPSDKAVGSFGESYTTHPDYLVGNTPLEIALDPGEYWVTVSKMDDPIDFRADGEDNTIFIVDLDEQGQVTGTETAGKSYLITKKAGHQALVTALFWPKNQALADFVASLPEENVLGFTDEGGVWEDFLTKIFQSHNIPPEDQPYLVQMLSKTGKAVWYSPDSSQHLYVYFNEPGQVVVDPNVPLPSDANPSSTPAPTLEPTPTAAAITQGPSDAQLVFNAGEPVVALTSDRSGNLYAVTYTTNRVLRIAPDGTSTTLYSGVKPCSYSLAAITTLPGGEVVVNNCVDDKDTLLEIDSQGNATTLPPLMSEAYEKNLLSMAADSTGRLYLGLWRTENNLTVQFSPTYISQADYVAGEVVTLEADGSFTTLYEGGLPIALALSPTEELYAALWGQSGPFSAESKTYSICDPRLMLWIVLSEQVQVAQLTGGQAVPVTNQMIGASSLALPGGQLLTEGRTEADGCGVFDPVTGQQIAFTEQDVDLDLTAMTASGSTLYFSDVDGNIYQVAVGNGEAALPTSAENAAPAVTSGQPETTAPVTVPQAAPAVPAPGSIARLPITTDNADQVVQLAAWGRGELTALTWSPNGKIYAAVGASRVWLYGADGQGEYLLEGHTRNVLGAVFSPDGTILASWGDDATVRLWDVATGNERHVLAGPTESVTDAAFSPDGRVLVSASYDGSVRLWDTETGSLLRLLENHNVGSNGVAFSPDGALVASTGNDNTVLLWDVATGETVHVLEGHTDPVEAVAFSPDGTLVASGGADETIRLWDVASGQLVRTLEGPQGYVLHLRFSPDGRTLVSESFNSLTWLWDPATGALLQELGSSSSFRVIPPPQSAILAASVIQQSDGTLEVKNAVTDEILTTLKSSYENIGGVDDLAFSPDGTRLASASGFQARLWDVATAERLFVLGDRHSITPNIVAFTADGDGLATAESGYGAVQRWDVATGILLASVEGKPDVSRVDSAAFSPNTTLLAVGTLDGTVQLWDAATGAALYVLSGHSGDVYDVKFSPDGKMLASAGEDQTVRVWDVATGTELFVLYGHVGMVESVGFSPHGTVLASGSWDGIRLWNLLNGTELRVLEGHPSGIRSLAFRSDGSLLAAGSRDGDVQLWNLATGELVKTLTGHVGWVNGLVFSPDGQTLASGSLDGTIRLWGVPAAAMSNPAPEGLARLGDRLEDPVGDAGEPYIDVTGFGASLEGQTLEAVIKLRDLPDELTFNRVGIEKDMLEYKWEVDILLDPADPQANFKLGAYYFAHDDPAFQGKIEDYMEVGVWQPSENGRWSRIDEGSIEVDYETSTIILRGVIPGITENALFSFQTYDRLAEGQPDRPS
jgi:WD40 repeat protein